KPGRDRVNVREAGQVADDRADGASPAPAGREQVARRAGSPHLERDLTRELENLPVEEEEAGEAELGDERELFAQARIGPGAQVARCIAVPLLERAPADLGQLDVGRIGAVREVRVA